MYYLKLKKKPVLIEHNNFKCLEITANFDLTQTEHKNANSKQISGSLNRAIYDLLNNSREKIVTVMCVSWLSVYQWVFLM